MPLTDEYYSACNDCDYRWNSPIIDLDNIFDRTNLELETRRSYFYFSGLDMESAFYCHRCGSFDISFSSPGYRGGEERKTGPAEFACALLPAIRKASFEWAKRSDIEDDERDSGLIQLGVYEGLVFTFIQKLARTATNDKREIVLKEFAALFCEWDEKFFASNFNTYAFLRSQADFLRSQADSNAHT